MSLLICKAGRGERLQEALLCQAFSHMISLNTSVFDILRGMVSQGKVRMASKSVTKR